METVFDNLSQIVVPIVVSLIMSVFPAYFAFVIARRKAKNDDSESVARLMKMYQDLATEETNRSIRQADKITKLEARIERLEEAQTLYVRVVRVLYDGVKLLLRQLEIKKIKPAWNLDCITDKDVESVLKELDDYYEENGGK